MSFWKTKNIDKVWANIYKHEGETFYTVTNIEYNYVIRDDCLFINNDSRRRITKENLEKALEIESPTCAKIRNEGIWAPSYIYGIISDSRIV